MQVRKLWDDLQSTLWFRPAIWVIGLGALAAGLTFIDTRLAGSELLSEWPWFLLGGAEGARTISR
jgi:uncharacterized membrane protein